MNVMRCLLLFVTLLVILSSCSNEKSVGAPEVKPESIFRSFMNYLVYNDRFVSLWDDFTPRDESENVITKEAFLQQLLTGKYLPLKLTSSDSTSSYQLYPIPDSVDASIASSVKRFAQIEQEFFQMEGKSLPDFHFTDLTGKSFTNESVKGKTLVLKCWFINCVPCVKEMPELNQLVKQYSNQSDLLFVSLALDPPEKLKTFLTKTKFDYAVVGDQQDYLFNQLKITGYPTHLVIDGDGKILKVVNNAKKLEAFLKKQLAKNG